MSSFLSHGRLRMKGAAEGYDIVGVRLIVNTFGGVSDAVTAMFVVGVVVAIQYRSESFAIQFPRLPGVSNQVGPVSKLHAPKGPIEKSRGSIRDLREEKYA